MAACSSSTVAAVMWTLHPCRCKICKRQGATLGCHIERCMATYHLDCARRGGCTFFLPNYSIGCPKHPHQNKCPGAQRQETAGHGGSGRLIADVLAPWRVVDKVVEDGEVGDLGMRDEWGYSLGAEGFDPRGCACYGEDVLDACEDSNNRFREETLQRFKPIMFGEQSTGWWVAGCSCCTRTRRAVLLMSLLISSVLQSSGVCTVCIQAHSCWRISKSPMGPTCLLQDVCHPSLHLWPHPHHAYCC